MNFRTDVEDISLLAGLERKSPLFSRTQQEVQFLEHGYMSNDDSRMLGQSHHAVNQDGSHALFDYIPHFNQEQEYAAVDPFSHILEDSPHQSMTMPHNNSYQYSSRQHAVNMDTRDLWELSSNAQLSNGHSSAGLAEASIRDLMSDSHISSIPAQSSSSYKQTGWYGSHHPRSMFASTLNNYPMSAAPSSKDDNMMMGSWISSMTAPMMSGPSNALLTKGEDETAFENIKSLLRWDSETEITKEAASASVAVASGAGALPSPPNANPKSQARTPSSSLHWDLTATNEYVSTQVPPPRFNSDYPTTPSGLETFASHLTFGQQTPFPEMTPALHMATPKSSGTRRSKKNNGGAASSSSVPKKAGNVGGRVSKAKAAAASTSGLTHHHVSSSSSSLYEPYSKTSSRSNSKYHLLERVPVVGRTIDMDDLIRQNVVLKSQIAEAQAARNREEVESSKMLETLNMLMSLRRS